MKFLIFLKQVPNSADIQFDSATKTLIRSGVRTEINPYDRRALSEAIRYRNENGGEVIAITMGPESSRDGLLEALIMGVDSAFHIFDRRLAGSDSLATSRVLAAAATKFEFDLIFCGQHSTDSETGQVPVELAELLGLPCALAAQKIEYLPEKMVQVRCETDEGWELLEMKLPAVISTAERLIRPIKTKNADLSTAPKEKIQEIHLEDLGLSTEDVGLKGSPTWVDEICDVRVTRTPEIWDGSDVPAVVTKLLDVLTGNASFHRRAGSAGLSRHRKSRDLARAEYWCWIENLQNQIRPVSLEILSTSAELGIACAMTSVPLTPEMKGVLTSYGAQKIFQLPSILHPDEIVALISERIVAEKPFAVLFPATNKGKYFAPRIAAKLQLGLTGDCVGLRLNSEGRLAQIKPAFGGNIEAPIYSRTSPQMATIRPGALEKKQFDDSYDPEFIHWKVPEGIHPQFSIIAQEIDAGVDAVALEESRIVVGVGAGLGEANLPLAKRLAELLQGSIGATRRVVDSGWVPRQFQVGLTGKFIAPEIYLGLAISGRYNHMIGVQKAGRLIAINQDPNAEVFQSVNIGIIGDAVAITTELINQLEGRN
jgi:electron transfer flavoprotein alpha subunit